MKGVLARVELDEMDFLSHEDIWDGDEVELFH